MKVSCWEVDVLIYCICAGGVRFVVDASCVRISVIDLFTTEVFMEMMEADAKQRCEQRRMREQEADYFKLAGNVAFKENDYVKALQFYNQVGRRVYFLPIILFVVAVAI